MSHMRVLNVWAENLYSFKKMKFDFTEYSGGTTMILGKNVDQKTANGAGKTSLFKTIYFILYGEDIAGKTKVPKKNVVRRNSAGGMICGMEIEHNGEIYTIIRTLDYDRKNPHVLYTNTEGKEVKAKKNDIFFSIDGQPFLGEGPSDTQKIILNKIKMTSKLFLSSILTAQDTEKHFITEDDSSKKELLSELLDLMKYEEGFKRVKEAIKTSDKRYQEYTIQMDALLQQIEGLSEDLDKTDERINEIKDNTTDKIKELNANIKEIEEDLKGIEKAKVSFDPKEKDALVERIATLKSGITKLEGNLDKEPKLITVKSQITHKIESLGAKEVELKENIEKINVDLEHYKGSIEEEASKKIEISDAQEKLDLKESLSLKIKEFEEMEKLSSKLLHSIETLNKNIEGSNDKITKAKKEIERIEHEAVCPTCERSFSKEDSDNLKKSLEKYETVIKEQESNIKEYQDSIAAKSKENKDFSTKLQQLPETKESLDVVNKELQQRELDIQRNSSIDKQISLLQKEEEKKIDNKVKYEKALEKLPEEKISLEEKLSKAKENLDKIVIVKERLSKARKELEENNSKLKSLELEEEKIKGANSAIDEKEKLLNKYKSDKKDLENGAQEKALVEMKDKQEEKMKFLKGKETALKKEISKLQEELKYLHFWKVGFSPTGIRSFITDDVIELLNQKTQENLDDLFDGALQIIFDPESTNKKGIISNKISTIITLNGEECRWDELSGGEKQRAILATDLAINEIAEEHAGSSFNVKFLDEPFKGMDDIGQQKSLSLFNRLAEKKDFFGIVSHSPLFQSLCPHKVYIVKRDKVSKFVNGNEFNKSQVFDSVVPDAQEESNDEGILSSGSSNKFDYDI